MIATDVGDANGYTSMVEGLAMGLGLDPEEMPLSELLATQVSDGYGLATYVDAQTIDSESEEIFTNDEQHDGPFLVFRDEMPMIVSDSEPECDQKEEGLD